jgi:hypothetical protein
MSQQLSRYEKLICEMDELAESVIRQVSQIPVNKIVGEPWSICTEDGKIIKHFQARIYDHIHRAEALSYWEKKEK